MKKFVAFFLATVLFVTIMPMHVEADDSMISTEMNTQMVEMDSYLASFDEQIHITDDNIEESIVRYNVPEEVADFLRETISDSSINSGIILCVPNENRVTVVNSVKGENSINSWGPVRQYNGYRIKDWVVTYDKLFDLTDIRTSSGANNIWDFVAEVAVYIGSKLADEILFDGASDAITLIQFLFGLESDEVVATNGDKIQAAPHFNAYETFTYIETSEGDVLGARTCKSFLISVTWLAFYENAGRPKVGDMGVYEYYETPNYDNRDAKAVQYHTTSPWLDGNITVKIENKSFIISH